MLYTIIFTIIIILYSIYYKLYVINKYPPLFYLPGILKRVLRPVAKTQVVDWHIPNSRNKEKDYSKPNVILIFADDLGYNDLSGGAGVLTPNIDSIGKNGVNFINSYSGHATCAPSRAAIMTGRFATRFGFEFTPIPKEFGVSLFGFTSDESSYLPPIVHNHLYDSVPSMGKMIVPLNETFLAKRLEEYGYNNYMIGKWHLGEIDGTRPIEKGYTDSLAVLHGASLYLPVNHKDVVNAQVGGPLDDFLINNLDYSISHRNKYNFQPDEYLTDYLTTQTIKLLDQRSNSNNYDPFFITLAYNAPHNPLQALQSDYNELDHIIDHKERVYASMIKALDRGVGRLIETLKRLDEYDNTIVVFTSDNGGANYIGLKDINYPFRGWKGTLFEGGIRVPLLMQWPAVISPNVIYDRRVGHVDIFSTILGAIDRESSYLSNHLDGKNLLDYLPSHVVNYRTNRSTNYTINCLIDDYTNYTTNYLIDDLTDEITDEINNEPHDYLYWRSGHYKSILSNNYKLQVIERPKKQWLFDLSTDPYESKNLLTNELLDQIDRYIDNNVVSNVDINIDINIDRYIDKHLIVSLDKTMYLSNYPSNQLVNQIDSNLESKLDNKSISLSDNQLDIISIYMKLKLLLDQVDSQQATPLWPAILEFAVSIDHTDDVKKDSDEEFIYWPN